MFTMTDTDVKTTTKHKTKTVVQEPGKYNIIYMNDDVTTQEFVALTLVSIFNYSDIDAEEITMKIHHEGSAVVATLSYELAEQKGIEVTVLARNHGFPLAVKIEQE